MTEEINKNNYPIIIIEDNNNGYYFHYINMLVNVINSELSLNTLNSASKNINNSDYVIDDYGKGIKHKRIKITINDNMDYWIKFSNLKTIKRKPTEIIVYIDK